MSKLTKQLLKQLVAEEYAKKIFEDFDSSDNTQLDPAQMNAMGKLNLELGNLVKALNAFKKNVLEDSAKAPVNNTPIPKLIKELEEQIGIISKSAGEYVDVKGEELEVKPKVKTTIVKPNVKVV